MSIAFDNEGNRDKSRDEIIETSPEIIDPLITVDCLIKSAEKRFPKSVNTTTFVYK